MGAHGLVDALEFDLRRLSSEARQTDGGFAGWATGLLGNGGKYGLAELRESAERSLLKVRSLASEDHETTVAELASSEEVRQQFLIQPHSVKEEAFTPVKRGPGKSKHFCYPFL